MNIHLFLFFFIRMSIWIRMTSFCTTTARYIGVNNHDHDLIMCIDLTCHASTCLAFDLLWLNVPLNCLNLTWLGLTCLNSTSPDSPLACLDLTCLASTWLDVPWLEVPRLDLNCLWLDVPCLNLLVLTECVSTFLFFPTLPFLQLDVPWPVLPWLA